MDNYSLDDYVNHSLGYYAKQLDEYNQDDNYATTILTLMDEQYHDYYDEKTAENPEKYYPIYDYISNMYLGKHLKAGMSQGKKPEGLWMRCWKNSSLTFRRNII